MIKIIVHAYVNCENKAIVEVVFASSDESIISIKMAELISKYPNDYLAVYDLPLDTDLTTLSHYPSVEIGKEDFN
ncbi:phosphoribosylaminoimidazole carboxylase [Streptococcus equinus]|uniref:phosphoribosylaminoimidazole carboxylase n=1 Tax=Streptococcus equinus TaxID=1335 RepID=UPI003BF8E34F